MPNSQTSAADLVNQLGIDGEAWFLKIVLGISCVSPRIATTLQAIASTAPSVSPTAPTPSRQLKTFSASQVPYNDKLSTAQF
ncbi:hypothetical protein [Limnospira platensis]|uniref:hypothetical protein n=1 Tax=Limnospira platensis TaxID=118562 RepID=UPI0021AAF4BE